MDLAILAPSDHSTRDRGAGGLQLGMITRAITHVVGPAAGEAQDGDALGGHRPATALMTFASIATFRFSLTSTSVYQPDPRLRVGELRQRQCVLGK
jgi:hypothetical protein